MPQCHSATHVDLELGDTLLAKTASAIDRSSATTAGPCRAMHLQQFQRNEMDHELSIPATIAMSLGSEPAASVSTKIDIKSGRSYQLLDVQNRCNQSKRAASILADRADQ